MGYIEDNLSSNEQISYRAHVSYAYILLGPVLIVLIGAMWGLAAGAAGMFGMIVVCGLFTTPLLVSGLIKMATTEVAVTNQRVMLKWGSIQRNTVEIFLDKIESITVDQNIFGRLLGYGSVLVKGTGGSGKSCPGIADPQAFRRAVNEHIQGHRFGSTSQVVPPPRAARPVAPRSLQYYYSSDGVDSGPHSLEEMRRYREAGTLSDETLVFREGGTEWWPAPMYSEIYFDQ